MLADKLFHAAGVFEKYLTTGGTITAQEAQFMAAFLNACGAEARSLHLALQGLGAEVDELVEQLHGRTPPVAQRTPLSRRLFLIEGGRA